jgi:hypothetical protein
MVDSSVTKTKLDWTIEMVNYESDIIPPLLNYEMGFALLWYNKNHKRGFRLTSAGMEILYKIGYPYWDFQMDIKGWNAVIVIKLDQFVTVPWHLNYGTFRTFDKDLAAAIALCNNDIDTAINIIYS